MARYRNDLDDDRDRDFREQQARREVPWSYEDSTSGRRRILENQRPPDYARNRFGERAEYGYDEPRYSDPRARFRDQIRKMGNKQVRRIPVVNEDGCLRGIISMADVAVETEADRELADAIEEISQGTSFWSKLFG